MRNYPFCHKIPNGFKINSLELVENEDFHNIIIFPYSKSGENFVKNNKFLINKFNINQVQISFT